jgi:RimJ/RimL family protein N-acetyltransferase
MVEIAYGIDEEQRDRGYATEAAAALVRFAADSGLVKVVRAHTKGDNPQSRRVLEKCGFHRVGEVVEPEDGLVDRWEILCGGG